MEMFGLRVRWAGRQQRYPAYSGSERGFGIETGSSQTVDGVSSESGSRVNTQF